MAWFMLPFLLLALAISMSAGPLGAAVKAQDSLLSSANTSSQTLAEFLSSQSDLVSSLFCSPSR